MPSPEDRLQELRRQRALVQEHLAWIDREIASSSGQAPTAPTVQIQPVAPPTTRDEADKLLESYQAEARSAPTRAYWGCIWAFAAALVLFALCVLALYLYVRSHQSPPVR